MLTQSTPKKYDSNGDIVDVPAGSTYKSRLVFLDFFYGINDRVDIGIQIPFCNNRFADVAPAATASGGPLNSVTLDASGVGDIRGFAKINLVQQDVVATLKLGVKTATGELLDHVKEEAVSLGTGQWDFDVILQLGRSFYPAPVYANVDLGYRLRLKNTNNYDPGEEFIYNAEIGANPTDNLLLALKLEGIRGAKGTLDSGSNRNEPTSQVNYTYFAPTVLIGPFQNLSLEASVRIPMGGREFFGGRLWGVGLYFQK